MRFDVSVFLALVVVVGTVVAVHPPPDEVRSICLRNECTCQERGLEIEVVSCDCGGAGEAQPLLVGDPSHAYISHHTRSLRVRRCSRVSLVSQALSNASRLTDLELSDLGWLELQSDSLYRTSDGPPLRVTVQRVTDLHVDPEAFRRVQRLQQLELTAVKGELPLGSFPDSAEVGSFRLADSWMGTLPSVLLDVSKADSVNIINCTFSSLDITVGDARAVTITDNTIQSLYGMRFNSSQGPWKTDAVVTMARNSISSLGVDQLRMTLHRLTLVNNTFGDWTAPLRVTYHMAEITGNDFGRLGGTVFSELARVFDGNSGMPTNSANGYFLTFGRNTVRGSYMTEGLRGMFLTPSNSQARAMGLFRIYDNRFSCMVCWELKDLVTTGETLLDAQPNDEGLYESYDVHGQLYRNSTCLEDGRSLQKFRQYAYTDDFQCRPKSAAVTVAAAEMLMMLPALIAWAQNDLAVDVP